MKTAAKRVLTGLKVLTGAALAVAAALGTWAIIDLIMEDGEKKTRTRETGTHRE